MAKKNTRNTKSRIVSAAWKLFYENGYDDTTVEEIVEESGTSKGSFYHYFSGKDALLSSLSDLFDDKYQELIPTLDPEMDSFEQLMYLNREMFLMIDDSISLDLRIAKTPTGNRKGSRVTEITGSLFSCPHSEIKATGRKDFRYCSTAHRRTGRESGRTI